MLALNLIEEEAIIGIFNAERNFEGLMINYLSNGHYIIFEGRVLESNYHAYNDKTIDIFLPFLYFMSKNATMQAL